MILISSKEALVQRICLVASALESRIGGRGYLTKFKDPFKYLNDRFPYPFIYLKSEKGTPFGRSLLL